MATWYIILLSGMYIATSVGVCLLHVPRLRRMWLDDKAAVRANSLPSELMWVGTRVIAMAYLVGVAQQWLIALAVALDLLGRVLIVAVLLRARSRVNRRFERAAA